MSFIITGSIVHISDITQLESGAKRLSYMIDTGEQYNNIYQFDLYKNADYADHVDNFVTYNKVGDYVKVEFNVSCRDWQGKYYTNLQHWKAEKVVISNLEEASLTEDVVVNNGQEEDSLPF